MKLTTDFIDNLSKKPNKNLEYVDDKRNLSVLLSNFRVSFRFFKSHNDVKYRIKIGEHPYMSLDQARDICAVISTQIEQYGLTDVRTFIRQNLGLKFRPGRLKLNDYIPLQPRPRAKISKLRKRGWKPVRGLFG